MIKWIRWTQRHNFVRVSIFLHILRCCDTHLHWQQVRQRTFIFIGTTFYLFCRLVREIMQKEVTFGTHEDFRISSDALQALQSSVEAYMVNLLEDASFCCRHRDRVTLMCKDIILLRVLRHDPALVRHLWTVRLIKSCFNDSNIRFLSDSSLSQN